MNLSMSEDAAGRKINVPGRGLEDVGSEVLKGFLLSSLYLFLSNNLD